MSDFYDSLFADEERRLGTSGASTGGSGVYDEMFASEAEQRQRGLHASLSQATRVSPDKVAETARLARSTGLPAAVVERNQPSIEQARRVQELQSIARFSPVLSRQLSDPAFASMAHDDAENLSFTEKLVNGFKRGVLGFRQSLSATPIGANARSLQSLDAIEQQLAAGAAPATIPDRADPLGARWMSSEQRADLRGKLELAAGRQAGDLAALEVEKRAIPQDPLVAAAQQAEDFSEWWEAFKKAPLDFVFQVGAESFPTSAPGLLAAIPAAMAAGPAGAAAALGANSFGADYASGVLEALQSQGVDISNAQALKAALAEPAILKAAGRAAFSHAVMTAAFDAVSGGVAGTSLAPAKLVGTKVGKAMNVAVQAPVQGALGAAGEVAGQAAAGDKLKAGSIMAEFFGEFAGTPVEVAAASGRKLLQARAAAQAAQQDGQVLEQLGELAQASKLRARDPDSFRAFVDAAAAEGPVQDIYVDARTFAQSLQESGLDVAQVTQASPAVAEQFANALDTGSDLRIPVGEYAAKLAGTEAGAALLPHLRTDPEAMSVAEAQTFMQSHSEEFKAEAAKVLSEHEFDQGFKESAAIVERELMAQLKQANRFTDEVNRGYAKLMGAFYQVQAARLGITPEQMYVRYPLQIRAENPLLQGASFDQLAAPDALSDLGSGFSIENGKLLRDGAEVGDLQADVVKPAKGAAHVAVRNIAVAEPGNGTGTMAMAALMGKASEFDLPVEIDPPTHLRPYFRRLGFKGGESGAMRWESQQYLQRARGSITFGNDIKAQPTVITLLQNADLSTFFHEGGHFYLEVLNDIAGQQEAPSQVVEDFERVLKWFGVADRDAWNSMSLEEKRPFHEQYARGFEAYLFEGRSPNPDMASLFGRFRAWLVNVYRQLVALNVELTEDVRSVFDRLLATNDQILAAEAARAYLPIYSDATAGGLSEEAWAEYQGLGQRATQEAVDQLQTRSLRDMRWASQTRDRVIRDLQRDAREKRRAVEAEVRAEAEAMPIHQARRFLRTGETRDPATGDLIKAAKGHRLNTTVLKEMYPETMLGRPDLDNLRGLTSAEGLHPDIVASMFGFQSGDQLVRELVEVEPLAQTIEGMTDQRMLERYGDLSSPDAIEQAADEAVHNEVRLRFIATGYKAASKAVGPVRAIVAAAKEVAAKMMGEKRIGEIRPAMYGAAEARAGKAALKAASDPVKQAAALRDQMLNHALARQAHDALSEAEKVRAFFRRVISGKDEDVVKARDLDIVNAARAILADYGFGMKAKSAAEYLRAVEAYDPGLASLLRERVEAATAGAKPFEQLTVNEMRDLNDEIGALWHLARRSRQMEIDGDLLDRADVEAAVRERIDEIGVPDSIPGEDRAVTEGERRVALLQSAWAALRRVESWVGAKDGNAATGPFRRYIWQPVREAADRYRLDRAKHLKRYRELLDGVADTLKPARIAAPELNYTFGYSRGGAGKAEILHALLHTGNESNKRKLLLGRHWATENADGTLDTSRWDAFVDRMVREGVLTKADYEFAQGVWDLLNEMKPLAQKTHRDVFGRYFAEVSADSFVTPFGTYRGGYVPALADPEVVSDAKTRALAEEENQSLAFAFPSTSRGFTKARVEYNRPLLLDLRSLAQHIDKVLLFSHLEQPVRDVRRVLSSKSVAYGLNRIDPAAFDGMLTPWLNRVSRQQVETPVAGLNGIMRGVSALRRNAGMAAMFANVVNSAQQFTGFSLAAVKVGPRYLLRATADYIHAPTQTARAVVEASPYMATRMENEVGQMTDAIHDILLNPSVYEKAQNWTRRHAYFMQSAVDNVMGPIIWTAAYNQALEQGLSEADARRAGDSAVRETQGSTLPEDISRMETGNAFVRLFTQFAGYFNMQANLLGTEFVKLMRGAALRNGMGRGLYVFLLGFLVPACMSELIVQAFRGGPDDSDKDGEYLDDWLAAVFGAAPLRAATALIPGVGQVANAAFNMWNDKAYDDRISTAPAISMIESAVRAPVAVYKAVFEEGKPSRGIRDLASLISITTGLPASALARTGGYLADVGDGRVTPTSGADFTRGAITGAASPESR